ncbi:hypothetical protein DFQ26_008733 [Actinomortierella ambigua]|nr:hypothetical protein DFQ26_008733 [Actinomortierella ambigua]
MGGGGQLLSTVDENATSALYACFSVSGIFAGAIHNKLGPKWTILIGSLAYPLYASSLLTYNHTKAAPFTIVAGGVLGVGAGLLWTAQGAMMMAYPREKDKGRYIGYFWAIFNMGAVLGSGIAFGLNYHIGGGRQQSNLADPTYIAFISIMTFGSLIALSLSNPRNVTHDNGEHIRIQPYPSWRAELTSVLKLFFDWRMLVLTPMFISSNWFYSYQWGTVNGAYFNKRTQSLNNIFYWTAQIIGSYSFAMILDKRGLSRRMRALVGLAVITTVFSATWVGGIFFQKGYTEPQNPRKDFMQLKVDYIGPLFLYALYGVNDAAWQTYCYWLMGSLSNDASILSRYAGYYKGVQSAGGAIAWRLNALKIPFMTELIICFALLIASVPGALFFALRVKDYSDEDEGKYVATGEVFDLETKRDYY